jgi:hypothetical protein
MYSEMFAWIITFATLATGWYFYIKRDREVKKVFKTYYDEKRKLFPWLDNIINKKCKRIAKIRASDNNNALSKMLLFLAIALIAGWALLGVIQFLSYMVKIFTVGPLHRWNRPVAVILWNAGLVIGYLIALRIVKKEQFFSPINGISLASPEVRECPSCHCPHAYVTVKVTNKVEKEYTERVTTTTTTTRSGGDPNDYGGGFIGGLFAGGGGSSTSRSTVTVHVFEGKQTQDLICRNCGHTESNTQARSWYENRPAEVYEYNSDAAEIPNDDKLFKGVRSIARLITILIIGSITINFFYTMIDKIGVATGGNFGRTAAEREAILSDGGVLTLRDTYLYGAPNDEEHFILQRISKGEILIIDYDGEFKDKFLPVYYRTAKKRGWVNSDDIDWDD